MLVMVAIVVLMVMAMLFLLLTHTHTHIQYPTCLVFCVTRCGTWEANPTTRWRPMGERLTQMVFGAKMKLYRS